MDLNCARSREWISLELDSALSRFEGAWLRRHLKACSDCQAYAGDVRGATKLLRDNAVLALPEPIQLRLPRRITVRTVRRTGLVAAMITALAAFTGGGLTGGSEQFAGTSRAEQATMGTPDLSAMRAIRRQELGLAALRLSSPRARVIEID